LRKIKGSNKKCLKLISFMHAMACNRSHKWMRGNQTVELTTYVVPTIDDSAQRSKSNKWRMLADLVQGDVQANAKAAKAARKFCQQGKARKNKKAREFSEAEPLDQLGIKRIMCAPVPRVASNQPQYFGWKNSDNEATVYRRTSYWQQPWNMSIMQAKIHGRGTRRYRWRWILVRTSIIGTRRATIRGFGGCVAIEVGNKEAGTRIVWDAGAEVVAVKGATGGRSWSGRSWPVSVGSRLAETWLWRRHLRHGPQGASVVQTHGKPEVW
jgi:hypothetical protein